MNVIVLGAGLVGSPIILDLAIDFDVLAVDFNSKALERLEGKRNIKVKKADLSNPASVSELVSGADFAVSAVPGSLGYATLEAIIAAGVHAVDIAFMPEDVLRLDGLAKSSGVTVISDMGVAPGMSNLLAGYAGTLLDRYESLEIYVGGLPKIRTWPWQYKAVFSPADVLEEYTRPARLVRNGNVVVLPALSEPELIEIEGIGTLECFNSDGLRSLIYTMNVPDMVEKTMRYPGHSELMRVLSSAGFFDTKPVEVGGQFISPLAITSKLLFSQWKLEAGEQDLTAMKIIARGSKEGVSKVISWSLLDMYDLETGVHSMARTTGYAATAALRLIASGLFNQPGVFVPEAIGRIPACVDFMLNEQRSRGIIYRQTVAG